MRLHDCADAGAATAFAASLWRFLVATLALRGAAVRKPAVVFTGEALLASLLLPCGRILARLLWGRLRASDSDGHAMGWRRRRGITWRLDVAEVLRPRLLA